MFKGFRDFIMRGNVVDLAVVGHRRRIRGSHYLVLADILTPLLGIIGVPDFSTLTITVGSAKVRYGVFLNTLISFPLVAASIYFIIIKPKQSFDARTAKGRRSDDQDLPPLRDRYPHRRHPLPELHQPAWASDTGGGLTDDRCGRPRHGVPG